MLINANLGNINEKRASAEEKTCLYMTGALHYQHGRRGYGEAGRVKNN
jgi:hypothetical protein